MKKVNAKIFALKYKLLKKLEASIKLDKEAIKNGAEITFKEYCNIKIVNCEKPIFDKDKIQLICDKYKIDIATLQKVSEYQRIDVDNVPTEVADKVENIFTTLEDSNDKDIKRVAIKMKNIK